MPEFLLTSDMLGELADDGTIIKHPARDIFGASYEKINATRKRLTKTTFVVIPAGKDSEDNTFTRDTPPAAPKGKE